MAKAANLRFTQDTNHNNAVPSPCFHKHISGVAPTHKMQHVKRVMTRESPLRRQEARTGGAGDSAGSARRRHEF